MKAQSGKDFFESSDYAGCLVLFEGPGQVYADGIKILDVIDLENADFSYDKDHGNFIVEIVTGTGPKHIPLKDISLPIAWSNTDAGKNACIKDLVKWSNETSSGGVVEVSNFPETSTVVDYNDFDHAYTYDSDGNMLTDVFKTRGTSTVVKTITRTYDASTGRKLTEITTV